MTAIAGAPTNTKKKQPAANIADLDQYGNHTFDGSHVDGVDDLPRFLKVTLGKGHKHTSPLGAQRSHTACRHSSGKLSGDLCLAVHWISSLTKKTEQRP